MGETRARVCDRDARAGVEIDAGRAMVARATVESRGEGSDGSNGANDGVMASKETRTVTLGLKITHATANVPSLAHLMEYHDVEVAADGSDTAADVKRKLSEKSGVPAKELCLRWFDHVIGRLHVGEDASVDERDTLAKFNVVSWIEKFPHWRCTLSLLEEEPRDVYESIHTAVGIHKNVPDVEAYVNSLRGTEEWDKLIE